MDIENRFCPHHPNMKIKPFATECSVCNKPLYFKSDPDDKPDPPKVQPVVPVDKTLHDQRIKDLPPVPPPDELPTFEHIPVPTESPKDLPKDFTKDLPPVPPPPPDEEPEADPDPVKKSHHKGKY